MALYLIGDVQGCDAQLGELLQLLDFSPSRDTLVLLGDLVNRGPGSVAVLRRMMALEGAARCLLGNHDLHLLGVAAGVRTAGPLDTIDDVLSASDRDHLLEWLRWRPLALKHEGVLMVHAGVLPQWGSAQVLSLAAEVQVMLRAPDWTEFMWEMYGNEPAGWKEDLEGADRLRVIVNALTRLRFCTAQGEMEFRTKVGNAAAAPAGYMPWFDVPGRTMQAETIAFGHWSTLGRIRRDHLLALDTGCVWGGCLTAVRLGADPGDREWVELPCPQAQEPGLR